MKRALLAVLSIFLTWSVIDYVIHGIILSEAYQGTAQLWRPMAEIKMGLMYTTTLLISIVFVTIYQRFFASKNMSASVQYGLLFGFGLGMSKGYGSFSVMPVPYPMAFTWFLGSLAEGVAAGLLLGLIIKDNRDRP